MFQDPRLIDISVCDNPLWQCRSEAYEPPHEKQSDEREVSTAVPETFYSDRSSGGSVLRDLHQGDNNTSGMDRPGRSKCTQLKV